MNVEQLQGELDCQVERLAPFGIQITAPQDRGDSIESVPVEVRRPDRWNQENRENQETREYRNQKILNRNWTNESVVEYRITSTANRSRM